jgi:hypothetical protein
VDQELAAFLDRRFAEQTDRLAATLDRRLAEQAERSAKFRRGDRRFLKLESRVLGRRRR